VERRTPSSAERSQRVRQARSSGNRLEDGSPDEGVRGSTRSVVTVEKVAQIRNLACSAFANLRS
jgi:hypothetical protein